jgi:hypothetical protein
VQDQHVGVQAGPLQQPAEAGLLTVLAAGPVDGREAVAPVLEAVGARTVWAGEDGASGAATRLKLVANSWVLAATNAAGEYRLVLPDGTERMILAVPKYDFNWQTYYMFREPLRVPKGARIVSSAWYDNSSGNPRNPNDPPKAVSWGEATTDEMCLAFLGVTIE